MNYYNEFNQEEVYELIPIYLKKFVLFQHIISIIVHECPIPAILLSLGNLCLERKAVDQGFQLIKSYWLKTRNLNKLDSKQILSLSKKHQYEGNWLSFLISLFKKNKEYKLFDMVGQENHLYVLNQLFLLQEYDTVLERIVLIEKNKTDNYQLDDRYQINKENILEFMRKISNHIESDRSEAFVVYLKSFDLNKYRNARMMAKIEVDYDYLTNFDFDLFDINTICEHIHYLLESEQDISLSERKQLENLNLLLNIYLANNLRLSDNPVLDLNRIEGSISKLQSSDSQWKFEPLIDSWISCTPMKPKPRMYTSLNEIIDLTKKELFKTPQSDRRTKDELIATPCETPVKMNGSFPKIESPAKPIESDQYSNEPIFSTEIKKSRDLLATPKKDSQVNQSNEFTTPIKYNLFAYCDENDFDPLTAPIDRKRKENQSTPSLKKLKQSKERYRKPLFIQNESEDELLK
ncbi:hypothetical protein HK103_003131 [Boothiomyces macroporosus]|uniref:Uncharacterized protein n=1 Tax=Boothiomyces macroporosus TaxID=261099 RepID=A0AAD5Y9A6_9FUNG|nr:hypothetical protein HK103_003131 [Boothiomyces macroporosus]